MDGYNGLGLGLGALPRLSRAQTRSVSPENFSGEKGRGGMAIEGTGAAAARDLGQGWKVSPSVRIAPGQTFTLADVQQGAGAIQQIWITTHYHNWRRLVLRFFWDGDARPAVEVPLGDFFCNGWCQFSQVSSLPVAVNPNGGMNCFWEMPFRRSFRITLENVARPGNFPLGQVTAGPPVEEATVYYQINYTLTDVPDDLAYFHAQWRRSNPLPYKEVHTLVDGLRGNGHYVGTYIAWGVNNTGWWGEGEIKFYLDGDGEFPTICGTGTEDYFGGAWNFDVPGQGYTYFSTPFMGLSQVIRPDGLYRSQQRFGMYRWHVMDPVRFEQDLSVTIQALGWRAGRRYLPLQDDLASTAFYYLRETSSDRPPLPGPDGLEVI